MSLLLGFQRDIFAEFLPESGLLVFGKGLGCEHILAGFVQAYATPKALVFLLQCEGQEEARFQRLFVGEHPELAAHVPFKIINNSTPAAQRAEIYVNGGVISITSRILLVDLLKERVPVFLVTGIILCHAHKATELGLEAFILGLYRRANKEGFIKAFSDSPEAFVGGFAKIEKTLGFLRVQKLFLYPRFQVSVADSLESGNAEVVEIRQPLTERMKVIQISLFEALESCLNEILKANPSLDLNEITFENSLFKSFDMQIRQQLDSVWHQIGYKTKQLVSELKTIRLLLGYLVQYDCVTFNRFFETVLASQRSSASAYYWLMLDAAHTAARAAKERVEVQKTAKDSQSVPEPPPKWKALTDILDELADEIDPKGLDRRLLILVENAQVALQLQKLLTSTAESVMKQLYVAYIRWKKQAGPGFAMASSDGTLPRGSKRRRTPKPNAQTRHGIDDLAAEEELEVEAQEESADEAEMLVAAADQLARRGIYIHTFTTLDQLQIFDEMHPSYVVLYDADLATVRKIEVYKALHPNKPLRLYFLIYSNSVEEQKYLTTIRREKDAFERLIHSKATMSLQAADLAPQVYDDELPSTIPYGRIGHEDEASNSKLIIVDMRELRSSLPFILYQQGFHIKPVTIEVGDYLLTPDICVERKSIPDLIGSLNSGRLFAQTEAMSRSYKHPVLLIEFDQSKSFSLQSVTEMRNDISINDISSKLVLLILHFPKLRLAWSPNLRATANMFRDLKHGYPDPSVSSTALTGADEEASFNALPKEMLGRLPGVTTGNVYGLMRRFADLKAVLGADEASLAETIGPINAKLLYEFIHHKI